MSGGTGVAFVDDMKRVDVRDRVMVERTWDVLLASSGTEVTEDCGTVFVSDGRPGAVEGGEMDTLLSSVVGVAVGKEKADPVLVGVKVTLLAKEVVRVNGQRVVETATVDVMTCVELVGQSETQDGQLVTVTSCVV